MDAKNDGVKRLTEFPTAERSLTVIHSFVHASDVKVTSLTISLPKSDKYCIFTFSDKTTLIRVKLSLDEIAGLSESIDKAKIWSCYHTFRKSESEQTEVRMQYNGSFINAEKSGVKIALKLSDDEKASLKLLTQSIYSRLL